MDVNGSWCLEDTATSAPRVCILAIARARKEYPGLETLYCIGGCNRHSTCALRPVTEQLLAFFSEKTTGDGDTVIALLEDESAGDQAGSPLVLFRAALAAIGGNVFLGDAVDDRTNSRPHAGAGAHGTGFVRGVEHEVGQVAAIAA